MLKARHGLVLLVAIALASTWSACGGGGVGEEGPQAVVSGASLGGVESGQLGLSVKVAADRGEGGEVEIEVEGPFSADAENRLPDLDFTVEAVGRIEGEVEEFEGGLTLLPGAAYLGYQGVEYEIDAAAFKVIESALAEALGSSGGAIANPSPCGRVAREQQIGLADLIDNPKSEGDADVGGTETTKINADLDVGGTIDALNQFSGEARCRSQMSALGPHFLPAELSEVEDAIRATDLNLYVGDDGILRRIDGRLAIEPPAETGDYPRSVHITFDMILTEVNEEQEITAPQQSNSLASLFLGLDLGPAELFRRFENTGFSDLLRAIGG